MSDRPCACPECSGVRRVMGQPWTERTSPSNPRRTGAPAREEGFWQADCADENLWRNVRRTSGRGRSKWSRSGGRRLASAGCWTRDGSGDTQAGRCAREHQRRRTGVTGTENRLRASEDGVLNGANRLVEAMLEWGHPSSWPAQHRVELAARCASVDPVVEARRSRCATASPRLGRAPTRVRKRKRIKEDRQ